MEKREEVVLLLKALNGLLQAARQFFYKNFTILKSTGFSQSPVDLCFLIKTTSLKIVIMVIHVDDCFTNIGNAPAIKDDAPAIKDEIEGKEETNRDVN